MEAAAGGRRRARFRLGMSKNGLGGLLIADLLGLGGFETVSDHTITIGRLRSGEGLGEGLVGCVDGLG